MAGFRDTLKSFFPLNDVSAVVKLFRHQLQEVTHPDLTLLSVVLGAIENAMTCNRNVANVTDTPASGTKVAHVDGEPTCSEDHEEEKTINKEEYESTVPLPPLELHHVEALYTKFQSAIKGAVDLSQFPKSKYATREIIKKVSDVIWNSLTRSYYKDRAHLQSLYSYLTGNKLDCFGVALAVVAGCQVLGFTDVHLSLSEDHAWVIFGENGTSTAEVTWHGKGNEDKRGEPIHSGVSSRSWLYLNGHAVICTRAMEVAAMVAAVNPSINATTDSVEIGRLQQRLLWLLYDLGHLTKYPMAIGNLGDLEEICPTPGRPPCTSLFRESINADRTYYANMHIYPYTYQGGYYYRNKSYKEALQSWADAADVIRKYNYSRDDEEVYKEFLEIANEWIPHIVKVSGAGHSAYSLLRDPECFARLLRFYDGICQWEEGSPTPVLHIGWARPLVGAIAKFEAEIRAQVAIEDVNEEDVAESCDKPSEIEGGAERDVSVDNNNYKSSSADLIRNLESQVESSSNSKVLESTINGGAGGDNASSSNPTIAVLTEACSENILNPDYLLGGNAQQPFLVSAVEKTTVCVEKEAVQTNGNPPSSKSEEKVTQQTNGDSHSTDESRRPRVALRSQKMRGLKELLLSEKLNTQAISLQLTAQSQVHVGRNKGGPGSGSVGSPASLADVSTQPSRPKRARRE